MQKATVVASGEKFVIYNQSIFYQLHKYQLRIAIQQIK